ncbi:hypothetical protein NQ318_005434 [Aromia moschata]|uniref:Atos-like conserved domain-containing protein n=1 Tax=Aromia moschata TaxID=1265417 RepID=A0AAV8YWD6_9CUCU|nr:hypothetical protein NQ318_005434 [Aromia moschata]
MHSSSFDSKASNTDGDDVLISVATLVTESRIPGGLNAKSKKFYEGPHCPLIKGANKGHKCDLNNSLCMKFENDKRTILNLCQKNLPLCIEVLLTCACKELGSVTSDPDNFYLLEQWHFTVGVKRNIEPLFFNLNQLVSAIRSQLYFSQITAWLSTQDGDSPATITEDNFLYHISLPGKTLATPKFHLSADKHDFPTTIIGDGLTLNVTFFSLPRASAVPDLTCPGCLSKQQAMYRKKNGPLVDDRMHTSCTLKGKHRCDELEEFDGPKVEKKTGKRACQNKKCASGLCEEASTSKPRLRVNIERAQLFSMNYSNLQKNEKRNISPNQEQKPKSAKLDHWQERRRSKNDLNKPLDKGKLLLDAIERSGLNSTNTPAEDDDENEGGAREPDEGGGGGRGRVSARQRIDFGDDGEAERNPSQRDKKPKELAVEVPSPSEQAKFRKNLDNAASMVFHSRTGLPLTSSPAPVRRGKSCFDFDSTINSVSAIKSPDTYVAPKQEASPIKYRRKGHAANLLGSFEESVLHGRLEPVSTVHGFTAELGASGSFVPKHLVLPVTVFFYTLGDNDKVSSPYLGHINLGKKGYNVPRSGTVQLTLFNPLGTVVKMFVIMYDLSDMPPNSQTFIRQRTLYMPAKCQDANLEWGPKWLRYLIHLRFMSSKSNKIYLHSDIRMIIFRKCDMDTATAHGIDMSYELRSFTHMPTNPRFSPRK